MNYKSRFVYTLKECNGILYFLVFFTLVLSISYFYSLIAQSSSKFDKSELKGFFVHDSVGGKRLGEIKKSMFNPNYIDDYFGYMLGLTPGEIDALKAYRNSGKYINSKEEFQKITNVSDTVLYALAPRFHFPVFKSRKYKKKKSFQNQSIRRRQDINKVDSIALTKIYGIGPVLAKRIINYRDFLGGFMEEKQLYEVYGLKPEVVTNVLEKYSVLSIPVIEKKDVNQIPLKDLAKIPYISFDLAKTIIAYRSKVGNIIEIKELTKLQHFPKDKIDIIEVYLTIK